MSPLRWLNFLGLSAAALAVLSFPSQGVASVNRPDVLMASSPAARKYCSAAFRYAARTGNDDIAAQSPAEVFAQDRHLARAHYAGTPAGIETAAARLRSATAMCGAG